MCVPGVFWLYLIWYYTTVSSFFRHLTYSKLSGQGRVYLSVHPIWHGTAIHICFCLCNNAAFSGLVHAFKLMLKGCACADKPTHHAVGLEEGALTVNKKVVHDVDTGEPASTLEQLYQLLSKKPKGWPVEFTAPVEEQ